MAGLAAVVDLLNKNPKLAARILRSHESISAKLLAKAAATSAAAMAPVATWAFMGKGVPRVAYCDAGAAAFQDSISQSIFEKYPVNYRPTLKLQPCQRNTDMNLQYKFHPTKTTHMGRGPETVIFVQIAKALQFIHERGIAHLDVKPDNIYVKNGIYKLGDFGCATLLHRSLPVEEGDALYIPQEILNEKYDCLDKVDIFSLGVTIYEIVRGYVLPELGPQLLHLREGKLALLPGHSMQFQNLLKVMMDPGATRRPSARELLNNPIFDRAIKSAKK